MIDPHYFWTNILFLGLGTFLIRSSVIFLSSRIKINERHREIFSYVPAAILPALAVPMVFYHQGHVEWLQGKERFIILILATMVAYVSRRMTFTLIFGVVALYCVSQF